LEAFASENSLANGNYLAISNNISLKLVRNS